MQFNINNDLLVQSRTVLFGYERLYWIVGGAGSDKSTICNSISARYDVPVYDMDAHIYGSFHDRFTQERHPVNKTWSKAQNGLAWLLDMSWDEFDNFILAALPEYLDLLTEDLDTTDPRTSLLIDGGISNPALLAQVIPTHQIVCLARPGQSSSEIWEGTDERNVIKEFIYQLPEPDEAWLKFLEFDERITKTILQECQENYIPA